MVYNNFLFNLLKILTLLSSFGTLVLSSLSEAPGATGGVALPGTGRHIVLIFCRSPGMLTITFIGFLWLILPFHSGKSLFPNLCGLPLLLFFWLKWAGYLAVAGLNLLAQLSDRISPSGV